jgi:hypothetical protein
LFYPPITKIELLDIEQVRKRLCSNPPITKIELLDIEQVRKRLVLIHLSQRFELLDIEQVRQRGLPPLFTFCARKLIYSR